MALLGDRWVELALEAPAPDTVVRAAHHLGGDVRLRVAAAGTCLEAGEVARAESMLEGLGDAPADGLALAQLFRARARGDVEGARRAVDQSAAPADAAGRAIVLAHLGAVEFAYGDPRAASEALEAGIALAREVHSEALLVACLGRAAALEVVAGRLSRAERGAQSALALAEGRSGRWSAGAAWACAALAAVHWLRGEPDQAEARADLGSTAAHGSGDLLAARAVRAVRGHLAITRGDIAGGCASLATAALHAEDGAGILSGWLDALGPRPIDVDEPVVAPGDRGGRARPARPRRPALRPAPRGAAARPDRHGPSDAVAPLPSGGLRRGAGGRPAHRWVRPPRARARTRVAGGLSSAVRAPASRCRRSSSGTSRCRHLGGRSHRSSCSRSPARDPAAAPTEPLSDRERDVLRLLPTLLRTPEIAGELFVSVNTVKTHVKSIYRKLDVSSRREAVARGRELRLI